MQHLLTTCTLGSLLNVACISMPFTVTATSEFQVPESVSVLTSPITGPLEPEPLPVLNSYSYLDLGLELEMTFYQRLQGCFMCHWGSNDTEPPL